MKSIALFLFALLSLAQLRAQQPDTWRKDGKLIADTNNMKSKDGFAAQLFLTESAKYFDDWNKPETPKLPPLQEARRNDPFFALKRDDQAAQTYSCCITAKFVQ